MTDGLFTRYPEIAYDPSSEASLRDAFAEFAHYEGWRATTERVVPGWGRIDLMLDAGTTSQTVIEFKLALTKPADIRRAFQQADGYGRFLNLSEPVGDGYEFEHRSVILSAPLIDWALAEHVAETYPTVGLLSLRELADHIADPQRDSWGRLCALDAIATGLLDELAKVEAASDRLQAEAMARAEARLASAEASQ